MQVVSSLRNSELEQDLSPIVIPHVLHQVPVNNVVILNTYWAKPRPLSQNSMLPRVSRRPILPAEAYSIMDEAAYNTAQLTIIFLNTHN